MAIGAKIGLEKAQKEDLERPMMIPQETVLPMTILPEMMVLPKASPTMPRPRTTATAVVYLKTIVGSEAPG